MPGASPQRFVTAVLCRCEKLCPAKTTPRTSVKLKVSFNAKQTLSQIDLAFAQLCAPMTAEPNKPEVGAEQKGIG